MPVLLLVCHQCEPCGCSSHNCTGHHSAESLTGSTHQPSWRVRHGSVRHPLAGKDFTLTIQWQMFAVFSPLTRGQVTPGPRYHALSDGMVPVLQRCSHILYRLFFTRSVRITFRALLTSSSCSALTSPDNPAHRHTPGNSFLQAPGRFISRGRSSGNGRRWRDCRNWRGTCGSSSRPL